ncbi:MAG TPA: glycogen synthase GlgA [Hydrogenophaga sp.]|uniref:glycogen synthase GlgA n=1 Tax=Hydrogenophaga sp. TaxID=1904254 RepID=UPI002B817C58|nr:glycogen synthase GlgA [Hydrogenophaga sp.]HMN93665.1 glycogen synthase GlgA [Hydrogenophaga sp.]
MKVLHACSELFPLLKTGGLADVAAALPTALQAEGCDVRRLLPAFPSVLAGVEPGGADLPLPEPAHALAFGQGHGQARILPGHLMGTGEPIYLLDAPDRFDRPGDPYLGPDGKEWTDNAERFALLSWAAAWLALGGDPSWRPDVLHAHDWHTGLAPLYLQLAQTGARPPAVFTVHNLAYQGLFPLETAARLGLPAAVMQMHGVEFHGQLSFMKAGLQYADAITTVSPRYAEEITTPEQGCGLDGLLRARRQQLHGILNGVDPAVWNPATDGHIEQRYDARKLGAKARNRLALQRQCGLEPREDALVFGVVSRLSEQKGLHLLPEVLDELFERGGQLVIQGTGDPVLVDMLQHAASRHTGRMSLRLAYDEPMAHRIIAGADVLLMPSRYEPCGLTQLYALRYGTLPLVHAVGGLADTVTDCSLENLDDGSATGFRFGDFSAADLSRAVRRAFALQRRPADWRRVQRNAMRQCFDWQQAARAYLKLYDDLTGREPPPGH